MLVLKSNVKTACRLHMMPSGYGVNLCPHLVWDPLPSSVIVMCFYYIYAHASLAVLALAQAQKI